MPWEKAFDADAALDRATAVFWSKGYEATSMADLIAAMGINKGSLYNAYGGKPALFEKALSTYDANTRAAMLAELAALNDPAAAITGVFDRLIADGGDCGPKGCFIINTAMDMPNQPPAVQALVKESLDGLERFFFQQIEAGQAAGQISSALNAAETAKALLSHVIGLRVLARGVGDVATLIAIRNQAVALIQ